LFVCFFACLLGALPSSSSRWLTSSSWVMDTLLFYLIKYMEYGAHMEYGVHIHLHVFLSHSWEIGSVGETAAPLLRFSSFSTPGIMHLFMCTQVVVVASACKNFTVWGFPEGAGDVWEEEELFASQHNCHQHRVRQQWWGKIELTSWWIGWRLLVWCKIGRKRRRWGWWWKSLWISLFLKLLLGLLWMGWWWETNPSR
jgi:hypothetical protein